MSASDFSSTWQPKIHSLKLTDGKRPSRNTKGNLLVFHACQRFGGSAGEVHVYADDGVTIERSIVIDGRSQYPQVVGD